MKLLRLAIVSTLLLSGCALDPAVAAAVLGEVARQAGAPVAMGTSAPPGPAASPLAFPSILPSNFPSAPATTGTTEGAFLAALTAVNEARAAEGKQALVWNQALADVAEAHSTDMAANNFFDHKNLKGQSPFDRMKAAGIRYRTAAENIAMNYAYDGDAVVVQWLNSPGHRANILDGDFGQMGLGAAQDAEGAWFWTQTFTN